MADGSRVPTTIDAFNKYINNTDDYIHEETPTNGTRLGLTTTNQSDWASKRTFWKDTLFPKYSDPIQSTSVVKEDVKTFMKDFRTFANPLLDVMAASPAATNEDAAVFHFVLVRKKPSHQTEPIKDAVVTDVKANGGGDMIFSCRTSHDTKRASKAEGADSVQVAFKVAVRNEDPPPVDANDGTTKEIFTKAKFILHAGGANAGKKLYVWCRWYNTKNPPIAGSWNNMITVMIT
ncbi:MAG: hypothetical protein ABI855_04805 [Bacteroidota bacterium]